MQTALARAPQRLASVTLTASQSAVYASPARASSVISAATITNPTAATVAVTIWIVPANGAPSGSNALLSAYALEAGASVSVPNAAGQTVPASGTVYATGAGVIFVLTGSVQT